MDSPHVAMYNNARPGRAGKPRARPLTSRLVTPLRDGELAMLERSRWAGRLVVGAIGLTLVVGTVLYLIFR